MCFALFIVRFYRAVSRICLLVLIMPADIEEPTSEELLRACLRRFTCDYLCFGLFGRTCVRRTVVRLAGVLFNRGFLYIRDGFHYHIY